MTVRYAYGVTAALLLGGTALSLSNPSWAQTAQNETPMMATTAPRPGAPMSFADLAARLQPAVVNISTEQRVAQPRVTNPLEEFFRRFNEPGQGGQGEGGQAAPSRPVSSLGSGFLISADGYIVTNNHLVQSANGRGTVDRVTVTLSDRREFPARIVGRDPATDLALLKVEGRNLPFVNFGDSTRTRVGDWIVAIGNPLGLGGTVTAGIVSAINRNIGATQYDRFIQTDAAINRGNSGGPMFDLNGNVIGINTALYSETGGNIGIGFAIPAEQARTVIDSLRRGQRVARGYLGVGPQPIDDDALAEATGVQKGRGEIIRTVQPGGAAARAGLQVGDVVTRIAGRPITPDENLSYIVAQQPPGSRIPIELIRDGRRLTVTATLAARPSEDEIAALGGTEGDQLQEENTPAPTGGTSGAFRAATGLSVQALTPGIANTLRIPSTVRGVIVSAVDPSSNAAARGVQRGDVILSIDGRAVTTPEAAAAAITAARGSRRGAVRMLVQRGAGQPAFVGIDLND